MTDSTTYFKNIWTSTIINRSVYSSSHRSKSKQTVVLPYLFNKLVGTWVSIKAKELVKKVRWLLERLNEDLPTLTKVVVNHPPLGDCRCRFNSLPVPKARLASSTSVIWSSIK
jgi:hypothetical protein